MPWPMRFGPGAEDDDPRPVRRADLALVLPRRVVVRRLGGELGGARVDGLVRRLDAGRLAGARARRPRRTSQRWASWASRSRAAWPAATPGRRGRSGPAELGERVALLDDRQHLVEEPDVDAARLVDRLDGHAAPQQLADLEDAVGRRDGDRRQQLVVARAPPARSSAGSQLSPRRPCSSERSAFCRLSGNVRPIAITSPTDCICVPSTPDVPGSFSNAQRGILVTT